MVQVQREDHENKLFTWWEEMVEKRNFGLGGFMDSASLCFC
jgi:hypothetical protein